MTLDIKTISTTLAIAAVWGLISYGTYRFQAFQSIDERNWLDNTKTRRIICVALGPIFWVYMILTAIADPIWDKLMRKVNRFNRWRARKPQRQIEAAERRKVFLYDPPV